MAMKLLDIALIVLASACAAAIAYIHLKPEPTKRWPARLPFLR